jgi:hypothetical protein
MGGGLQVFKSGLPVLKPGFPVHGFLHHSFLEELADYTELASALGSLVSTQDNLFGFCKASIVTAAVTVYECKALEAAKLARNPASQKYFLSQMAIDWAKATKNMDPKSVVDLVHPALLEPIENKRAVKVSSSSSNAMKKRRST